MMGLNIVIVVFLVTGLTMGSAAPFWFGFGGDRGHVHVTPRPPVVIAASPNHPQGPHIHPPSRPPVVIATSPNHPQGPHVHPPAFGSNLPNRPTILPPVRPISHPPHVRPVIHPPGILGTHVRPISPAQGVHGPF